MILCLNLHPYIDELISDESSEISFLGKGLNVARSLMTLGEQVFLLGFMGEADENLFHAELEALAIPHTFVIVDGCVKHVMRQHTLGKFSEKTLQGFFTSERSVTELLSEVETAVTGAQAVVLSGVLPRGTESNLYARIMEKIPMEIPVFIDTPGEALFLALEKQPYLIKPNVFELEEIAGRRLTTLPAMKDAVVELHEAGAQRVLVSMGAYGALFSNGRQMLTASCNKELNTPFSGAGDSMLAAAVHCAVRGTDEVELLKSSVAAGTAAATVGGNPLDFVLYRKLKEEIEVRPI